MPLESKPKPEKDRSERWLLTYADLITLLMVFFVILYSFSIIDVKKFQDLKGSLDKAFSEGVLSGLNTTSLNASVAYGQVQQQITSNNRTLKASVASQLQKTADATGSGNGITVTEVTQGVTVSLASQLLFLSGTATLKPGADTLLAQIGAPLKELDNPIEIVSNTDELGPQSTNSKYRDNWLLGNARSYNVLRVMVDKNSFPEQRLSLWNKAQYSPMFPNDTPENRAKNRRVDLLIVFPDDQAAATAQSPA
ncbi:MAG TPA: flagellar motor protein MotB, partial [Chloroflexota bacterium]|nr:flagellar motor protein MotB [Chloroflexota bacterium]